MSFYTPFIEMALEMINEAGMDVSIVSPVLGGPLVPGQTWKPTNGTPVLATVRICFFPEETINYYTKVNSLIAKEDHKVGYEYYLMGNTGFTPELNQVVIKPNLEEWRIKYVKEYAPAGETVLWIVGLKR